MQPISLVCVLVFSQVPVAPSAELTIPPEAFRGWEHLHGVLHEARVRIRFRRSLSIADARRKPISTTIDVKKTGNALNVRERTHAATTVIAWNPDFSFQARRPSENSAYRLEMFRTGEESGRLHRRARDRVEPFLFASFKIARQQVADLFASDQFYLRSLSEDEASKTATITFEHTGDESAVITSGTITFSRNNYWAIRNFDCVTTVGHIKGNVRYRPFGGAFVPEYLELTTVPAAGTHVARQVYELLEIEPLADGQAASSLQDYGLSKPEAESTEEITGVRWSVIVVNVGLLIALSLMYLFVRRRKHAPLNLAGSTVGTVECAAAYEKLLAAHRASRSGRAIRSLIVLSAIVYLASVMVPLWHQVGPPSWVPRIRCDDTEFDVGQRRVGDKIAHEFVLHNTGDRDLVISNVMAKCGCITPVVSEAEIPPGFSLKLPVTISLDLPDENLRKQLAIESNDPVVPLLVLEISGRVGAN